MDHDDFYWSAQARLEFASLFDDGSYSAAFQRAVAEAFAKGWSGNRDKPLWAMAVAACAHARAARSLSEGGNLDAGDGLGLVWGAPRDLLETLLAADGAVFDDCGLTIRAEDGAVLVSTPDGLLRLTGFRLAVLKKLAELLLCANNFDYAPTVMQALENAVAAENFAAVKDVARELSRLTYQYRTEHVADAHANSGFTIVRNYLASLNYEIADDTILEFWCDPENQKYQTYEASYRAFAAFAAAITEAEATHAALSAQDINDPVIAGQVSAAWASGLDGADADGVGLASAANDAGPTTHDVSETADTDADGVDPQILGDTDFRLLNQKEVGLLSRLHETGAFGQRLPTATLRLLSFHIVQSGLSNALRTGKAKVPMAERVHCGEAVPYPHLAASLEELSVKLGELMGAATAAIVEDASSAALPSAQAANVIDAGSRFLAKARSKALQRPADELRDRFIAITPALVAARTQVDAYARVFAAVDRQSAPAAVETTTPDGGLALKFDADRPRFAAEFARRYADHLGPAPQSAAPTTLNDG